LRQKKNLENEKCDILEQMKNAQKTKNTTERRKQHKQFSGVPTFCVGVYKIS
jgi:hypothetical protein